MLVLYLYFILLEVILSKQKSLDDYIGCWWLQPHIDWSNIGADVTHRPVEIEALNRIALEVKHIRNLSKWELELTPQEYEIFKLDQLVNSINFDVSNYPEKKIYKKDTNIVKVSKLSNYSEMFVRKNLQNISRKIYLCEILNLELKVNNNISKNNYNKQKKSKYYKRLSKLKRVV